ncbi:hypothetical protein ACJEBK_29200 [Peribacillus frigoritolerans]
MKEEGKKKFTTLRQTREEFHIWHLITFKEALFIALGGNAIFN